MGGMTDLDEDDDLPLLPAVGTGMPASIYLDMFGMWPRQAFCGTALHVGSSAILKTWRDVDVRMILPDEKFNALFPDWDGTHQNGARWALMSAAISELGTKLTGLPIDFQFQRMTDANAAHKGRLGEPLDLYSFDMEA